MQLHVFQKAADKDLQIRIQSGADRAVEREDDRSGVFGVTVYGSTFLLWIHDPVFLDPGLRIQSVLCGIIHPTTGRRDNFNDPVRSTETAMVMELVPVADYGDIRFHPIFIIGIQVHGERGHKQPLEGSSSLLMYDTVLVMAYCTSWESINIFMIHFFF